MAAKKVSRATTKKLKDKWRAKQWYTIHAPELFESREIPPTPADDPTKLTGRIVEVTMQELTQEFSKSHIKLKFRINRVAGFDAYTDFVGHEFTSDYIRRLTRRRRTKVDGVFDVTTKDGYRIRVKPMAIAEHRIQSSQKAVIRQRMLEVMMSTARSKRMGEFIKEMINGDVSRDIFRACKSIYRLKRIDIRRSDILGQLSGHKIVEDEPVDIDAIPEGETHEESEDGEVPEGGEEPEALPGEDIPAVDEEAVKDVEGSQDEAPEVIAPAEEEIPEDTPLETEESPEMPPVTEESAGSAPEEVPIPEPETAEPAVEDISPASEDVPAKEAEEETDGESMEPAPEEIAPVDEEGGDVKDAAAEAPIPEEVASQDDPVEENTDTTEKEE